MLLCGVVACDNDKPLRAPHDGVAISFNADITRATVSSAADIEDFRVYAVMSTAPDQDYNTPSDVVYNHILKGENGEGTLVWYDATLENDNGTTGGFTYDDTQYWINDRTFHFFAFWPATTPAKIANDGYSYELEYSATTDANDDLLTYHYSTYVDMEQTDYPTVPITFKRMLTQISFEISQNKVTNQFDKFHVTSVALSGIKAGGSYTTSRYDKEGSWHFSNDKLNFLAKFEEGEQFDGNNQLVIFENLNLVPQEIKQQEVALVVNYTYQQGDNSQNYGDEVTKSISTYLPIVEWKAGRKYTYKMELSQDNILIFKNISVNDWGEQPDAGTIIIK